MGNLCKYAPEKGSFYCKFYETILCPGNRENCVRYEPNKRPPCDYIFTRANDSRNWCSLDEKGCSALMMESCAEYKHNEKKDKALDFHKFCTEHGIVKACFEFEDGTAVDYLWLSNKEFQLSRVGDCATNYIVP